MFICFKQFNDIINSLIKTPVDFLIIELLIRYTYRNDILKYFCICKSDMYAHMHFK